MLCIFNKLEREKKKKLRKYDTLMATDYLRKSSNANLIYFKNKSEDVYGIISSIITYKIDSQFAEKNPDFFTIHRFNTYVRAINDMVSKLDDFDTKLFRKFIYDAVKTNRDIHLITYILTDDYSLNNIKMVKILDYVHNARLKNQELPPITTLVKYSLNFKPTNEMDKKLHYILSHKI